MKSVFIVRAVCGFILALVAFFLSQFVVLAIAGQQTNPKVGDFFWQYTYLSCLPAAFCGLLFGLWPNVRFKGPGWITVRSYLVLFATMLPYTISLASFAVSVFTLVGK